MGKVREGVPQELRGIVYIVAKFYKLFIHLLNGIELEFQAEAKSLISTIN